MSTPGGAEMMISEPVTEGFWAAPEATEASNKAAAAALTHPSDGCS